MDSGRIRLLRLRPRKPVRKSSSVRAMNVLHPSTVSNTQDSGPLRGYRVTADPAGVLLIEVAVEAVEVVADVVVEYGTKRITIGARRASTSPDDANAVNLLAGHLKTGRVFINIVPRDRRKTSCGAKCDGRRQTSIACWRATVLSVD